MRVLDLFSGTRSATRFFAQVGDQVEYVDILDGIDALEYHAPHAFDFVWASPPCQEYSYFNRKFGTWESKYDTSDALWLAALRIIKEARPRWWIIENVKGAQQRWGRAPYHYGPFFLWGYYPPVPAKIAWATSVKGTHLDRSKEKRDETGNITYQGLRSDDGKNAAEKAMIPELLAKGVYQAITGRLPRSTITEPGAPIG